MAWSCKNWDSDAFLQQALREASERHAVVFACAFLPDEGAAGDGGGGGSEARLLAAAYSTGSIRVFDWRQASKLWLGSRQPGRHVLQWHAHGGGVYALAVVGSGPSAVLLSCGDDGCLRGWSVGAIAAAAAAAAAVQLQPPAAAASGDAGAPQPAAFAPEPLFEARVPRAEPLFPVTVSAAPAAQALAVDAARGAVYVGASDGGCHAFDLGRLGSGSRSSGGGGGPAASFSGHAAAVLGMDCCPATGQVATASEDATVRVWDARAAPSCTAAIDVAAGAAIPPSWRADQLRCLRSPYASSVRLDAGGNWLVAGGGGGSLAMWSLQLGALAKRLDTGGCVPQAIHLLPGEILVAGSGPGLQRYRFTLEPTSKAELCCGSAFALDVHPGSGAVAVGGARGVTLLSPHNTRLGRLAG